MVRKRRSMLYGAVIAFSVLLSLFLAACFGSGDRLNEKEQMICDMVSSSIFFCDKESVNVISGTVMLSSDEKLFDNRAYLKISYKNAAGDLITGSFKFVENQVSNINDEEDILNKARNIEMSEWIEDDIDYDKINDELNK